MSFIPQPIIDAVAQYGPFPVGIIVGMYISRIAHKESIENIKEEKKDLREEKKELLKALENKEERLDTLHRQLTDKEDK